MTTLILIRHGETEANVEQRWQGSSDAPLTARGQLQVAATAQRLAELKGDLPVDAFYVSPLLRARSTALAIGEAMELDPTVEYDLREFDLGAWEGRTYLDLRENERLWERWAEDPTFAPPEGESPHSFHIRALAVFARLSRRHACQTVLVVTHGAIICNVLASWLGEGPEDWRRWEAPNCAITILNADGTGWRPILVNDVSHLPPEAVVMGEETVY